MSEYVFCGAVHSNKYLHWEHWINYNKLLILYQKSKFKKTQAIIMWVIKSLQNIMDQIST